MRIVTASSGNSTLKISQTEWIKIGQRNGWLVEAKSEKKEKSAEYDPNPWAVCHKTCGPKKSKKFERCVLKVKKEQEKA